MASGSWKKRRDDEIRSRCGAGDRWAVVAKELGVSVATVGRAMRGVPRSPRAWSQHPAHHLPKRTPSDEVGRFWGSVEVLDGHAKWIGATATFKVREGGRWRTTTPARYAYRLHHGVAALGRLRASCGDPACVDARHLAPATRSGAKSPVPPRPRHRNQATWRRPGAAWRSPTSTPVV